MTKLNKSTVSRRVGTALAGGYLKNLEDKKGRPFRLELGDPLPEECEILPAPDVLEQRWRETQAQDGLGPAE